MACKKHIRVELLRFIALVTGHLQIMSFSSSTDNERLVAAVQLVCGKEIPLAVVLYAMRCNVPFQLGSGVRDHRTCVIEGALAEDNLEGPCLITRDIPATLMIQFKWQP